MGGDQPGYSGYARWPGTCLRPPPISPSFSADELIYILRRDCEEDVIESAYVYSHSLLHELERILNIDARVGGGPAVEHIQDLSCSYDEGARTVLSGLAECGQQALALMKKPITILYRSLLRPTKKEAHKHSLTKEKSLHFGNGASDTIAVKKRNT